MARALPSCTALVLALLVCCQAALAKPFTYVNDRYGTQVTFPDDIFADHLPPPDNGDGMTFTAADGASVAVYGSNNVLDETPRSMEADAKARAAPGYQLTYSKTGKDWVVLSGIEGGLIFYHRLEFGREDVIHAVLIKYPPAARAKYDPLVGRIAGSLQGP